MKSQKNICFSQEQNKSLEVTDELAFFTQLCFFHVHIYLCFGYTPLAYALFSSLCEAIRTGYHSWSASLYYVVNVFEIFLCLLLSFFVVDFLCRFNLLNYEFCVKAFLKRLSIYFPQPSDLVVIIPQKLLGLPFPRSDHKLLSLSVANFYGFCWCKL